MSSILDQVLAWAKKCDHKNQDIKVLELFEGGYTIQCGGCGQIVTHKEEDDEREKEENQAVGSVEETGGSSDVDKVPGKIPDASV